MRAGRGRRRRRQVRDAHLTSLLASVFEPGKDGRRKPESLYGAVKAWGYLRRQGIAVARCTVERLMRANGWRGNVRGRRKTSTTVPDPGGGVVLAGLASGVPAGRKTL